MEQSKQTSPRMSLEQQRLLTTVNALRNIIKSATSLWKDAGNSVSGGVDDKDDKDDKDNKDNKDNNSSSKEKLEQTLDIFSDDNLENKVSLEERRDSKEQILTEEKLSLSLKSSSLSYLNSTCANLSESPFSISKEHENVFFTRSGESFNMIDTKSSNSKISNILETDSHAKLQNFSLSSRIKKSKKSKKVPWKRVEEIQLIELIEQFGEDFAKISLFFPNRTIEDIKDKFYSKLNPTLNTKRFSQEEDEEIIKLHSKFGNKWNVIAKFFPKRNSNMIKNRFYSYLKSKMRQDNCSEQCFNENNSDKVSSLPFEYENNFINTNNNKVHDINFDNFLNKNEGLKMQVDEDSHSFDNFQLNDMSELNPQREKDFFNSGIYNLNTVVNNNLFTTEPSNSLFNIDINNNNLFTQFNNDDFLFDCNKIKSDSFLCNPTYSAYSPDYSQIVEKYGNLETIVNKMLKLNTDINDKYSQGQDPNLQQFESLRVSLQTEIEILKTTKDTNDMIPQNSLLKIIDLMIELTKIIRCKIEYMKKLK